MEPPEKKYKEGFSSIPYENYVSIDEDFYSRQLYVLGRQAMHRIATAEILISGMKGLGVEVAKNVILGGVKSVVLHDECPCELRDLSAQYFLTENDIGVNRAQACFLKLAHLNAYVKVSIYTGKLTKDYLKSFKAIVLTDSILSEQLRIGEFAHSHNIGFIIADTKGLFGQLFCDFGEQFTIYDVTGEQPHSSMISSITKDKESVVACLDETKHGFEDGVYVTFSEVVGMTELNGCEPRKIKVLGPYTFSIGDTSGLSDYIQGGIVIEVKMPKTIDFKSLKESIESPEFVFPDVTKSDRAPQLHLAFQALHYFKYRNRRLPRPWNKDDAEMLLSIVRARNSRLPSLLKINDNFIRQVSYVSDGDLCPMQAVIGGITAQEVLKCCSGKFHPIFQWLYFDSLECLPKDQILDEEITKSTNCRYGQQIAVFGKEVQKKLENLNYFIAGAGAVGCEHLKNFSMMGIGTGEKGRIFITDMDCIEKSNLNRQFLFRSWDVGKMKAEAAAQAVLKINPDVHITSYHDRVGPETEVTFNEDFFDNLNGVASALDNIASRIYIDEKCVYHRLPLLEAGTLGTKGSVQVVVPFITESYASSHDPPEKSFPMCTLKTFPNAIEHTLQWARDEFYSHFNQDAQNAHDYLTKRKPLEEILSLKNNQNIEFLASLKKVIVDDRLRSFEECILWARMHWEEQYSNKIKQLLFNFPPDSLTENSVSFWSNPKRCPHPLTFDETNPLHLNYVVACANLKAFMYGIPQNNDVIYIAEVASNIRLPEFVPLSGVRIAVNDYEAQQENHSENECYLNDLLRELPTPEELNDLVITPTEFEKDDDSNYHLDFIVAASNLRAENYGIPSADRLNSKLIAGNIIPAIATTTAVISGLVCFELYKLVQDTKEVESYKNGFINLALPFFSFSEPVRVKNLQFNENEFNIWHQFEFKHSMTLRDFLDYFLHKHQLKINMISYGLKSIYGFYMNAEVIEKRLDLPLPEVVENVTKERIENHVKSLAFTICCEDINGKDVDVPIVRYLMCPPNVA